MKPHSFVFGLICLALVACTQPIQLPSSEPLPDLEPQASNWASLGGTLDRNVQNDISADYAIAVFDRNPVVVWSEREGTSYNLYVKRWTGSAWVQLGGALDVNFNYQISISDLALDAAGNPVVSWIEYSNAGIFTSYLYVKRWTGANWVQLGTSLNVTTTFDVRSPSLVLDSLGNPVVAWEECSNETESGTGRICNRTEGYVKRWNGNSWVQLGGALNITANQLFFAPSLALDHSGNPVVSWQEFVGNFNIYVKRWNGTNWVQIGTVPNTRHASSPSLAVNGSGHPVMSWIEYDGTSWNIYVKRWNGSSWVQLGTTFLDIFPNHDSTHPNLVLDSSGNPLVSWYEREYTATRMYVSTRMYVKRWNGSVWILYGSAVEENTAHSGYGGIASNSIALDSSGSPLVAVVKNFGSYDKNDLYVKRLNIGLWKPLPPSDRNLVKNATEASVALMRNGTPGVAWQEDDGSSNNIHASFWSGGSWIRYGGVLDTTPANQATAPSLAFRNDDRPVVAWQERVGNNTNIFIKQWNGSAWINYGTGVALDRNVNNQAYAPSLALDSTNSPYVAWYETVNGSNNIFVKRWDNVSSWVNLGGVLDITLSNQSSNPSLAIDSLSRPVVAWQECMAVNLLGDCTWSEINVRRWNGSAWELLSDSNRNAVALSINPSLAIDAMDIPVVAYQENDSIRVKRWNGNLVLSKWNFLGDTLDKVVGNQASNPSLDLQTNGKPVVAWTEVMFESTTNSFYSYLLVKRWTGASWQGFPSNTFSLNHSKVQNASSPSLVIGSSNIISIGHQEWDGTSTNLYVTEF